MPNLAFHLEVMDKVIDQLIAGGDPHGTLMKNNRRFAALGALGPDLLRYLPISTSLGDALVQLTATTPVGQISSLPLPLLQELFLNPVGAIYTLLFRQIVIPNWPTINEIRDFFNKLDAIVASQNELAIPGVIGEAKDVLNKSKALSKSLPAATLSVASVVGQIIALPPWMEQTLTVPVTPADPHANRLAEFLRWHRTGAFARNLIHGAANDHQTAFALGWLCHIAGSVTGEPFINNITGGPYRTHWWRNRLVGNFVDAWTFGFYQSNAQMTGDDPTPPYAAWKPLCSANLQDEFNVASFSNGSGGDVPDALKAMASGNLGAFPGQFPTEIADLLETAVNQTYPAAMQPIAGFSADVFRQAFVGAFSVYWFMTSGSGPMCDNPLGAPPANCTTPPSWISSGSTPSPQQAGVNPAGAACAILLAIFALLLVLCGDLPGGMAALIAALEAPAIDWATVACNLFWLQKTLVDAENALRDALIKGGLAYPPPDKLGTVDVNNMTHPALDLTPPNGIPLTQSNALSADAPAALFGGVRYPRVMDATNPKGPRADLNFNAYPPTASEQPSTENLMPIAKYPNFVVDASGLQNSGLMTDGTFPTRLVFFGDAVANALQLITQGPGKLPDYNLDGDRGDGWEAWHPQPGTVPATPPVVAVQD
jgi:hypothetical protein